MKIPRAPVAALCLTPACLQIASDFARNLSPDHANLDPCTDFEELVCGGWRANHQLRPDQGRTSTIGLIDAEVEAKLRDLVEGPYPGKSSHSRFSLRNNLGPPTVSVDEQNFNTLQRAYNACMDTSAISALGVQPIVTILDGLNRHLASNRENWPAAVEYLKRVGANFLMKFEVGSDPRDPDAQLVRLSPNTHTGLGQKSYYNDSGIVSEYRAAIAHIFRTVHPTGANPDDADKWAAAVVDFEVELAEIMPELAQLRGPGARYYKTLSEADELMPQLGIPKVLKALAPADYDIKEVLVSYPRYFSDLAWTLAGTPRETFEHYLWWKVIQNWEYYVVAKDTFRPWHVLSNKIRGREPDAETDRWRKCVSHVDGALGWIFSRFFVETSFSEKSKELGNEIISEMRQVYIDKFQKLDWIDDEVRAAAVDKVKAIVQKIGYPTESPNITDPASLQKTYSDLPITTVYKDNIRAIKTKVLNDTWSALVKSADRKEWEMTAPTVNAYYSYSYNEIVFPAGIMQPPLFNADLPSYVNYGAFGSVAGHEVSHGFDDGGRLYDAKGQQRNWWPAKTAAEYNQRARCFVEQFEAFNVTGADGKVLNIRGNQTLGENIADSAGISASYAAWEQHRRNQTCVEDRDDAKEGLLPGLDQTIFKTPEQLFFLAYGNLWCTKATPAALTRQVLVDSHSPAAIRIKGTLQNSRGFKEAFGCPVKEPVCELW